MDDFYNFIDTYIPAWIWLFLILGCVVFTLILYYKMDKKLSAVNYELYLKNSYEKQCETEREENSRRKKELDEREENINEEVSEAVKEQFLELIQKEAALHSEIEEERQRLYAEINQEKQNLARKAQAQKNEYAHLEKEIDNINAFFLKYRSNTKKLYKYNISPLFLSSKETRKFIKAASMDFDIISCDKFDIKCKIQSGKNIYETSLEKCTCQSFTRDNKPCKHIIYLALALGCVADCRDGLDSLEKRAAQIDAEEQYIKSQQLWWEKREKELEQKEKRILDAEEVLKETGQTHPGFAALMQHYDEELDRLRSQKLALRAPKSKETVDQVKEEKRQLIISNKQYLAQIAFYEAAFPWLTSIKDLPIKEAVSLVTSQYKGNNNEFRDRITTLKQYGELRNAEMEINQMLTELEHQVENK